MSDKANDLLQLLNIFAEIVEANKGTPSGKDLRVIDAESLALKFFGHSISALYLYRGVDIPDLILPIKNFPDPFSFDVLIRAAFESFLVFYFIYIDSKNDDEADLRYYSWEIAGLYQRQKYPVTLEENITKQQKEKEIILSIENKIKENLIFNSLPNKKKQKYFDNLKKGNWRLVINKDKFFYKGWIAIAQSAGFTELNSKHIYNFLCEHAHSGNISATQVSQSFDFRIRRELMEGTLGLLLICVASFIKSYLDYFPKSKELYFSKYPEPNIVSFWIDIGTGNIW
ncbi:MAG: DUF5677 domain-containing protein [Promethearchaeota archaeon]